jgi:hypothetical protein
MTDLRAGWHVVGNDGGRVGTVRDVSHNYVVVETGAFGKAMHVPASAIGNIERETVHLNVASRDAESMGWEQPPRDEDSQQQETDLNRHV